MIDEVGGVRTGPGSEDELQSGLDSVDALRVEAGAVECVGIAISQLGDHIAVDIVVDRTAEVVHAAAENPCGRVGEGGVVVAQDRFERTGRGGADSGEGVAVGIGLAQNQTAEVDVCTLGAIGLESVVAVDLPPD